MHPKFKMAHEWSFKVIGAAMEVHRELGPGLLESIYEGCLVVEIKAAESVLPVHKAQTLTYMKLLDAPLGLIVNFYEPALRNGIVRLILKGADA